MLRWIKGCVTRKRGVGDGGGGDAFWNLEKQKSGGKKETKQKVKEEVSEPDAIFIFIFIYIYALFVFDIYIQNHILYKIINPTFTS